jgi:hypothetical protein
MVRAWYPLAGHYQRLNKYKELFVTGVMLSNASIDVAFHDTYYNYLLYYIYIIYNYILVIIYIINEALTTFVVRAWYPLAGHSLNINKYKTIILDNENINSNNILYKEIHTIYNNKEIDLKDYIEQFFVGLLEGVGTIAVDFISNTKKRIRVIIAIDNKQENQQMIDLLVKYIGGKKTIERNNKYVVWIASSRTDLIKVFSILAKYPLLTTTKQLQLDFAKDFINNNTYLSKDKFIELRNNKFNKQSKLINFYNNNNFNLPYYFPGWLSGYIEAKGYFKLIKSDSNKIHTSQLIIGHNYDIYLLKAILKYFNASNNTISFNKDKYYRIYLTNKNDKNLLFNHFNLYPLLGYKYSQYIWWKNNH